MGVLVVDFFDTQKNQVVGTSKIMMKLYIKRAKRADDEQPLLELKGAFPITLTGNPKVTIGQFNLSMTSSFPVAYSGLGANSEPLFANIDANKNGGDNNLDVNDSFIANERKAQ
jgi:hypothetical protein